MALPPLPEGAVSTTVELPPLPEGATTHDIIPIAEYIPTDVEVGKPIAVDHDVWDKIATGLSGGKYGSWKDLFHGGEKPEDSYLKELSQIIESSGMQGLTGIGPIAETPAIATAIGKNIPNIPSVAETFPKVASAVSKVGNKISDIPANVLSWKSGLTSKDLKDIYALGKEGDKNLFNAFREHQQADFPLDSIANYNYAMTLGVPNNVARMATHYGKDLDSGAHMLKNLWENQNPITANIDPVRFQALRQELLSKLAKLSPERAKAEILGIKTGDLIQPGRRAFQSSLAQALGFGGVGTIASHYLLNTLVPGISAAVLPFVVKSPKVASELALKAGQVNRYVPKILKSLKNNIGDLDNPQIAGAIGSANEYLNSED